MVDDRTQQALSEALSAARSEAGDLEDEIRHLGEALNFLERRKQAADDVCRAIRRWIDLTEPDEEATEALYEFPIAEETATVSLSEEEVSLIAYPSGRISDVNEND